MVMAFGQGHLPTPSAMAKGYGMFNNPAFAGETVKRKRRRRKAAK